MVAVVTLFLFLIPHNINKAPFILAGLVILTVGAFLTGPSRLFGLPNEIKIMTAGMLVAGVGKSLARNLAQAYVMIEGEREYPQHSSEVQEKVAILV